MLLAIMAVIDSMLKLVKQLYSQFTKKDFLNILWQSCLLLSGNCKTYNKEALRSLTTKYNLPQN